MAVPDFQAIMLPLVRSVDDGLEHDVNDCVERLADELELTPEDRAELLPSGKQARFANRVNWAVTHLYKAGLIERTGRRRIRVTERGRQDARIAAGRIDMAWLARYPEYALFQQGSAKDKTGSMAPDRPAETPEEELESSFQNLRDVLADDLLDRIMRCPPEFFERLVVDVLVAMGYGGSRRDAGEAVGRTGDGGIDGIIKEDQLGLDVLYVQAKRWNGSVGRPVIQAFAGSLEGHRARKGVLITTSDFTAEARDYVTRIEKRIVLLDGHRLSLLMIDHGVGVVDVATYQVKRLDAEYFDP